MMLKKQIELELKEIEKYFGDLHTKFIDGELTQDKYILLLTEHNALIRAYRKVLDTKRVYNKKKPPVLKRVKL